MHRFLTAALALLSLPVGQLTAQGLDLGQRGGAVPGPTTFQLSGAPGSLYALLFALNEQTTPVPSLGITLDIPDMFAGSSLTIPGFAGALSGNGTAAATVQAPNEPWLTSLTVSLQAVGQNGATFSTSNLLRLTPQLAGSFAAPLNQPTVPVIGGGALNLPGGELLFVGGSGPVAQTYNSRLEEWRLSGATFGVGLFSQTTPLNDGRVLFTGGLDLLTGQPSAAAAVYDPATQTTTNLTMALPRAGHGASLMGNGRVLVTGGLQGFTLTDPLSLFTGITNSTEIFDPATNTFIPGPAMLEARGFHTSTTLTNGQVLIAGGLTLLPIVNIPTVSATAYRFNPASNSFGIPAFFSGARFLHSAAPLSNGKVLLVGGITLDLTTFLTTLQLQDIGIGTLTDCQVYTQSLFGFGTFQTVGGMQEGRAGAAVAPLANGGALIAGGIQLGFDIPNAVFVFNPTNSADVYASNNTITATGSMSAARTFPTTVNLPDGTVMVVGGGPLDAEIYQPN